MSIITKKFYNFNYRIFYKHVVFNTIKIFMVHELIYYVMIYQIFYTLSTQVFMANFNLLLI